MHATGLNFVLQTTKVMVRISGAAASPLAVSVVVAVILEVVVLTLAVVNLCLDQVLFLFFTSFCFLYLTSNILAVLSRAIN